MPQLIDSPVGPVTNGAASAAGAAAVELVQVAPTTKAAFQAKKNDDTIATNSQPNDSNTLQDIEASPVTSNVLALIKSSPISTPSITISNSAAGSIPDAPALAPGTAFIKSKDSQTSPSIVNLDDVTPPTSRSSAVVDIDTQLADLKKQLDDLKALSDDFLSYGGRSALHVNRGIMLSELEMRTDKFQAKRPWYKRVANFFQEKFSSKKTTPPAFELSWDKVQ